MVLAVDSMESCLSAAWRLFEPIQSRMLAGESGHAP